MKILIIDEMHFKNKTGIILLLEYLKFDYKFCNINDVNKFIIDYDIIHFAHTPFDSSLFPNKKFIFGSGFSVFPDNRLLKINNIHKNSIYIQPSKWAADIWKDFNVENIIKIKEFPFPVEIDKFKPIENSKKNEVFVMFKQRDPKELEYVIKFLDTINIKYKLFDYVKKYKEDDYISCLQNAKYGIWIGRHESQGFGLEEALAFDIPILVWEVKYMSQEYGYNYPDISASVIPYWDKRCGEFFVEKENFEEIYYKFIDKIETYKPREYILENLSPKKCGEYFIKLINSF
jgi:hypothetical protein